MRYLKYLEEGRKASLEKAGFPTDIPLDKSYSLVFYDSPEEFHRLGRKEVFKEEMSHRETIFKNLFFIPCAMVYSDDPKYPESSVIPHLNGRSFFFNFDTERRYIVEDPKEKVYRCYHPRN